MTTPDVGLGVYVGAIASDVGRVGDLNLGSLLATVSGPQTGAIAVAVEQRKRRPGSFIAIRTIPVWATEDADQYHDDEPVGDVVSRWVPEIAAAYRLAPPGTFDLACGINERTPAADDVAGWTHRLDIEWAIGFALAGMGIEYGWLSGNVGCLDTPMLAKAARLFERFVTVYHGYLKPDSIFVGDDGDYFAFRPYLFWLPELRRLFPGKKPNQLIRGLFLGETGTYKPWDAEGLDATKAAQLCREINRQYAMSSNVTCIPYHGSAAYGYRLVGDKREGGVQVGMSRWNLDDGIDVLRGVGVDPARIKPGTGTSPVTPPSPTPVPTPPNPPEAIMKTLTIGGVEVIDVRDRFPYVAGRTHDTRALAVIDTFVQHHFGSPLPIAMTTAGALPQLDNAYRWHTGITPGGHDWPTIGYTFAIDGEGRIYYCNDLEIITYHARAANGTGVGVVWLGTFDGTGPPPKMIAGSKLLLGGLRAHLGHAVALLAHYEAPTNDTDCCGRGHWPATKALILKPAAPAPTPALNRAEVAGYAEWVRAALSVDAQEVRGDVGKARFVAHLKATGRDGADPTRYGWPCR